MQEPASSASALSFYGGDMEQQAAYKLPKKKKLCIVGCAEHKSQTPFNLKDEFEYWGVNNLYHTLQGPWTRWFELHHISQENGIWMRRGKKEFRDQPVEIYLKELGSLKIPVYMQGPNPLVPNAVPYPLMDVLKLYGDYLTNTISYMMALALMEQFEEVHIYGVDMAVSSEYYYQRPSCEYFLGIMAGKGVKIVIPKDADLLKTRFLYGFHEPEEEKFHIKLKKMRESMEQRKNASLQKAQMSQKMVDQYIGAQSALVEVEKIWGNSDIHLWGVKRD